MVTLNEIKTKNSDKVYQKTVDEFRRSSALLDKLVFDDAVNPSGTSTLTYSYLREEVPSLASFREIGTEYESQESTTKKVSSDLKVFGGSFKIDRVIQTASGKGDETARQMKKKIAAAASLFHASVINGDADTDNGFDGLDKALRGTNTELNTGGYVDLSTQEMMDKNYKYVLDLLDALLSEVNGTPAFIMANTAMITKLKGVARRSGYLTHAEDAFGKPVEGYNGIPFLDLGFYTRKEGSAYKELPCVPIAKRTVSETEVTGLTDIYVPVIDLDHFHGVTLSGTGLINSYLPNFKESGAVKTGEAEMVATVALKSTRGAAVLRNIKIK